MNITEMASKARARATFSVHDMFAREAKIAVDATTRAELAEAAALSAKADAVIAIELWNRAWSFLDN